MVPELDNVIAYLELVPPRMNEKKNATIGDRQGDIAGVIAGVRPEMSSKGSMTSSCFLKGKKVELARQLPGQTTMPFAWIVARLKIGSREYLAWLVQQRGKGRLRDSTNQGVLGI